MTELTNEMLTTAIKHLSIKRQNLYTSVTNYELEHSQRDHLNSEIDDLNDVIGVLERERDRRRQEAAA